MSFTLNKTIFNERLYSHLRAFWFADLPPNFTGANKAALRRWWNLDSTEAEKKAFDASCRDEFLPALEALGPEQVKLPPFDSHKSEAQSSSAIAGPLLNEIRVANGNSAQEGADTLLSLVILLDQMPRNIFRSQASLPLVYRHYDRLAYALVRGSMTLSPNPVTFPAYATRPALQSWSYMPLLHSEDLAAHELWDSLTSKMEQAVPEDDVGAKMTLENGRKAWKSHVDIIREFGRYPHRNTCLGRESSKEELEWLKTGDNFGVSQGKDEL